VTDLSLHINDRIFSDWTEVNIVRSLDQLASSFGLAITDLWSYDDEPIPLREGSACTIYAGTTKFLSGYVDGVQVTYDANNHNLSVFGRSKLGDLVDCSVYVEGGQFRESSLEDIATAVCAPFGISVVSERLVRGSFRRFATQESETCYETINRAAKAVGATVTESGNGNLLIPGQIRLRSSTVLEYGKNILKGSLNGSWADRYSEYTVTSQNSGSDEWFGKDASQISASVEDDTVDRYRPLRIVSEAQVDGSGASTRAKWERNTRAARAQRVSYTVRGWEDGYGFWSPGTLVPVKDRLFNIDTDLLLVTANFTKNNSGTTTTLELTMPEAYNVLATPPRQERESLF
jgi:prophage tail gpP-like protein